MMYLLDALIYHYDLDHYVREMKTVQFLSLDEAEAAIELLEALEYEAPDYSREPGPSAALHQPSGTNLVAAELLNVEIGGVYEAELSIYRLDRVYL